MAIEMDVRTSFDGFVAIVEFGSPPHNYLDHGIIARLADELDALERNPQCRAVVLCSGGKSFSAGANLAGSEGGGPNRVSPSQVRCPHIYKEAIRLFGFAKPIVAAIQGAAVGAGVGLALIADFRIGCPEARFATNFSLLGFHPGFGITATLPRVVGQQHATMMLYTGRRLKGEEAKDIGLLDILTTIDDVRPAAIRLAEEISRAAPLAVASVRRTMRRGLTDLVEAATERELVEQNWLRATEDFLEGKAAVAERRPADFHER